MTVRLFRLAALRAPLVGGLVVALGVAAVGFAFTGSAQADETAANPSISVSSVHEGVLDTLSALGHRVERHGQYVLDEKALEYARRADDSDEQRRLEALNTRGQEEAAARSAASTASADANADGSAAESPAADDDAKGAIEDSGTPLSSTTPEADTKAKSSKSTKSTSSSSQTAKKKKKRKNTLYFQGEYVPFAQGSPADTTAPALTASTWVSTGDVDDGENTYFIGHNPGVFARVMDLEIGDKITVWDASGAKRTYYVFDILTLPNATNYYRYEGRIAPRGETITLQTCCADEKNVRCVMAR